MEVNGKAQKQALPLKLTFSRPNKLNLNAGPVRLNSDGATMSTVIEPLKRYTEEKAPEAISIETFRQGPLGAVLFGGPSGAPMFVVLSLLTAPDAPAALEQLGGTLKIAPEDPKTKVSGLLIDQEEGPDIRLNIDPATKLLSGIDFLIDPAMLAQSVPAGQKLQVNEFGWKPGAVKTEPTADEAFAYVIDPRTMSEWRPRASPRWNRSSKGRGAVRNRSTRSTRTSAARPPTSR